MATPNLQADLWLIEEKIAEFYQCKMTLEETFRAIVQQAQHGLQLIETHPEVAAVLENIRSVRKSPVRGVEYRRHLKKLLEAYSLAEICSRTCLTEQQLITCCLED